MTARDETNLRPIIAAKLAERAGISPDNRLYAGFHDRAGDVIDAFRRQPKADPVDEIDVLCAEIVQADAEKRARRNANAALADAMLAARRAASEIDPAVRRLKIKDEATGEHLFLTVPKEWVSKLRPGTNEIVPG